jgi:hypothetical protein
MTTIDTTGKVAYMYDQETDTWYAISGAINTAAPYTWTSTQQFNNTILANDVLQAKAGVNNFQNPTARNTAIPSPINGIVCFVRQEDSGEIINQIQYYYNGVWRSYQDSTALNEKTSSYTLVLSDAGKTINMNVGTANDLTVPLNGSVPFIIGQRLDIVQTGAGQTTIVATSGVTINSKNSNKKIAARYSGATLIKTDTNTWLLIGDLTA